MVFTVFFIIFIEKRRKSPIPTFGIAFALFMQAMQNVSFQLYIDSHSILNLNSDFFDSIHYHFENGHVVKIEVRENTLCRLIKRDIKCVLRIDQQEPRAGVITHVRKKDKTVFLTCKLEGVLCAAG